MPAIQEVQKVAEVPQVQYIDKIVDAPVQKQRQVPMVQKVQKTVEVPQVQFTILLALASSSTTMRALHMKKLKEALKCTFRGFAHP